MRTIFTHALFVCGTFRPTAEHALATWGVASRLDASLGSVVAVVP
jgi:hypothetical protein